MRPLFAHFGSILCMLPQRQFETVMSEVYINFRTECLLRTHGWPMIWIKEKLGLSQQPRCPWYSRHLVFPRFTNFGFELSMRPRYHLQVLWGPLSQPHYCLLLPWLHWLIYLRRHGFSIYATVSRLFYRLHKSHIVNLTYVETYIKAEGGYVVLSDGTKLPVAERKRNSLMEIIDRL